MSNLKRDDEFFNEINNLLSNEGGKKKSANYPKWFSLPMQAGSEKYIRLLPLNKQTTCVQFQHWGDKPFTCLKTFGKECPVCEFLSKLVKEIYASSLSDKCKKEVAKRVYSRFAKSAVLWYAFEVKDNVVIPELKIVRISQSYYNTLVEYINRGKQVDDEMVGNKILFTRKSDGKIDRLVLDEVSIENAIEKVGDIPPILDSLYKPTQEDAEQYIEETKQKIKVFQEKTGCQADLFVESVKGKVKENTNKEAKNTNIENKNSQKYMFGKYEFSNAKIRNQFIEIITDYKISDGCKVFSEPVIDWDKASSCPNSIIYDDIKKNYIDNPSSDVQQLMDETYTDLNKGGNDV